MRPISITRAIHERTAALAAGCLLCWEKFWHVACYACTGTRARPGWNWRAVPSAPLAPIAPIGPSPRTFPSVPIAPIAPIGPA